jgi:cytochrome c-type biogenesis protein CcmF
VFLGTLYPLLIDALGAGKISVGPPYFEAVFVPLMAPALFLMGVGPLARWKRCSLPSSRCCCAGRSREPAVGLLLRTLGSWHAHGRLRPRAALDRLTALLTYARARQQAHSGWSSRTSAWAVFVVG